MIRILSGLLVVQVALIVFLSMNRQSMEAFDAKEKLIGVDSASISKIVIEDGDNGKTELVKKSDKWILPDVHNFPADPVKIEKLVNSLFELKKSWIVANTSQAAKKFKVSERKFEKKISILSSDNKSVTLLLGTSPGFKKVHARLSGEKAIRVIDFEVYEAGTKASDWYDRGVLKFKKEDLRSVSFNSIIIEEKDGKYVLKDLKPGETMDEKETGMLLEKLAGLTISDVLGTEDKEEYKQATPYLSVLFKTKDNESFQYKFSGPYDTSYYVLKSSKLPYYFKVAKGAVDGIAETERTKLVKTKKDSKDSKKTDNREKSGDEAKIKSNTSKEAKAAVEASPSPEPVKSEVESKKAGQG